MKLNLKKPIIFFDLERTGLDISRDRIVELCYIKIEPNGNEESRTMRLNPEMHIAEQSSKVQYSLRVDTNDTLGPLVHGIERVGGAERTLAADLGISLWLNQCSLHLYYECISCQPWHGHNVIFIHSSSKYVFSHQH